MKVGLSLSNNQGIEDVQDIVRLAVRAEALGLDSVWASGPCLYVGYVLERIGNRPYYDPLTILTYVAAKTERIALGTSVLVLPYHQPMRLAKAAATLDVMSGGRLLLGVGVGVIEQELNAMGSPYAERGAITDETINILKRLWTEKEPRHEGKRYQFAGMKFSPKPVQKPHIPLIIGGVRPGCNSPRGAHRQWLAPDGAGTRAVARGHADPGARGASRRARGRRCAGVDQHSMQGGRAGRYALGTEPAEMIEKLQIYQQMGVNTVVVSPYTGDAQDMARGLEVLARDVIPALRAAS